MRIWIVLGVVVILLIPFILKADLTKKILFSNKGYAKEIEVKTYILTQEQLIEIFKNPENHPMQMTVNELNKIHNIYFVIRMRNLGNKVAWGKIVCEVPGINVPIEVTIPCIREYICNFVVCIADVFVSRNEKSPYPLIPYEWSELYTK